MINNIKDSLQNVFRKTFEDDTLIISQDTTADDIKMWDSLIHIELIAAVEKEFDIHFSFNEVMQFNSVGDLIKLIAIKIK